MGAPDKRVLYITFLGAVVTLVAGVLLLMQPSLHIILLAMLFLISGEAVFMIWGINRTNLLAKNKAKDSQIIKGNKGLWELFLTGTVTVVLAIIILLFKNYLEDYVAQLTSLGLVILLVLQWSNNARLYKTTKTKMALSLLVIVIVLTVGASLLTIFSLFVVETRYKVLAALCFLSAGVLLGNSFYTLWVIKSSVASEKRTLPDKYPTVSANM